MNRTHTYDPPGGDSGGSRSALFGSRIRGQNVTHQVQGRLTTVPRSSDLTIMLSLSSTKTSDSLPPPPRTIKPVAFLVEESAQLFGAIDVHCHAVFEYDQTLGYKSKISLPIPLMFQDEETGITHIESAQFGRRDGDNIEYQIVVENHENPDVFMHSVSFESTVELSTKSIRGLLNKARSISSRLLIRLGGKTT